MSFFPWQVGVESLEQLARHRLGVIEERRDQQPIIRLPHQGYRVVVDEYNSAQIFEMEIQIFCKCSCSSRCAPFTVQSTLENGTLGIESVEDGLGVAAQSSKNLRMEFGFHSF